MKSNYASKWILQRVTALILIPLTFWFIYQCISFQSMSYGEIIYFFQSYINSFLFLIMMTAMMIHAKLGCETIVEDYVSSNNFKVSTIWVIKLITYGAVLISVISVFSIVFKIILFFWTLGIFIIRLTESDIYFGLTD